MHVSACPFCSSQKQAFTWLEDTYFNQKAFQYKKCRQCELVYVQPFPAPEDYAAMYPTSYQSPISLITNNSRYTYIFDVATKFAAGKRLLDYGCGSGQFLGEALAKGYECTGVEYNSDLVARLQLALPQAEFYTIDAFSQRTDTFDVIYLSNVLEHLTNPKEIMQQLRGRLSEKGVFVIEGPIENNFTLALQIRKIAFGLRKLLGKSTATHPPYHIFQATAKNQRQFFRQLGLDELVFQVKEDAWPFPASLAADSNRRQRIMYRLARLSISLSQLNPNWGNTFLYVGKLPA